MAYRIRVDTAVACAFITHSEDYAPGDGPAALRDLIAHPDFAIGFSIVQDYRAVHHPAEMGFRYFVGRRRHQLEVDAKLGPCKLALLATDLVDFGNLRQLVAITSEDQIRRMVFRDWEQARDWLGLPAGYDIDAMPDNRQ